MNVVRFLSVLILLLISSMGPLLEVEAGSAKSGSGAYRALASRIFEGVRYDVSARELTLTFQQGGVYVYRDVPVEVFEDFTRIVNKGEYFSKHIRNRYACDRVMTPEAMRVARR